MVAQLDAFHYDSARVPVGRAYEYLKSNRDGTHAAPITLFVAARDRLESFKWDSGGSAATLVVALMDWRRFSVRRFESWQVRRGQPDTLLATLQVDSAGQGLRFSAMPDTVITVAAWPWHSCDFDFASLGLTLPHLRQPEAGFHFRREDVIHGEDGFGFGDFGAIEVSFLGRETRRGRPTRRYQMTGAGLRHTTGMLWSDAVSSHIVEFAIPIPDEPGFRDVRLRLQKIFRLSATEWERYQRERVGE
jgi:hypothetical protein